MSDYISRNDALNFELSVKLPPEELEPFMSGMSWYGEHIKALPSADVVKVVRCKDCKYRIVNEHYGEKGYIKLKAFCDLDTGDIFELGRNAEYDDWFCADGERRQTNDR